MMWPSAQGLTRSQNRSPLNVYLKYIEGICEYLETTPNYLFYGKDEEGRLSPAEKDMIRIYRKLDSGRKKCVRDTLKYFEYGIDDKEQ